MTKSWRLIKIIGCTTFVIGIILAFGEISDWGGIALILLGAFVWDLENMSHSHISRKDELSIASDMSFLFGFLMVAIAIGGAIFFQTFAMAFRGGIISFACFSIGYYLRQKSVKEH